MASSLLDIQARVLDMLKRKDVPQTTLNRWITDGVRRIQRELRTPMDEAVSVATIPTGFNGSINIPGNLVELISIRVNGQELAMRSGSEVSKLQRFPISESMYFDRYGSQYRVAPLPAPGSKVEIYYRADWTNVSLPTDNIKLFDIAADLVCYAALLEGGVWSVNDPRISQFNDLYNQRFISLQDLADRAELQNGSMAPCYNFNGDWNP